MYKKYAEGLPEKLVCDIIDFLIHMGQEVIVAPYEADPQLAALWLDGEVDWVISEDSDLLAFGCLKLIRGLRSDGKCQFADFGKNGSKSGQISAVFELGEIT